MKKHSNSKMSLLVSASAVAGLAIGATVALAAHPPIQLFTYEEVAAQMNGTHTTTQTAPFINPSTGAPIYANAGPGGIPNAPMPVMVAPTSKQGMPYSPKQTCTGGGNLACHSTGSTAIYKGAPLKSYEDMADKSFHSTLGINEWMDNSDSGLFIEAGRQTGLNPQKPWVQSHGHAGKWCVPSLRQSADFQKPNAGPRAGKTILYPGTMAQAQDLFLNGGTGVDGQVYPKTDLSAWDMATMCATCHVGGPMYEKDRAGVRLPVKTMVDMGSMMAGQPYVNPFTSTVWEEYTAAGVDTSFTTLAPWIYPQYNGNKPANGPMLAPYGWGQAMTMVEPNTKANMPVVAGQLMMPNVKEMDCLFCHFKGYDNIMTSVMVMAGSLNAAPGAGAGLFDMTPGSPTYMGFNPMNGKTTFTRAGAAFGPYSSMQFVSLTPSFIDNIKPKPDSNNCMQCHATGTLKNLPEMFGVTGTSSGFMSSAPMIYDPANGVGPLGKRMVAYDINAVWLSSGTSPVINFGNAAANMMPGMNYPAAMGASYIGGSLANAGTPGYIGGGNNAMSGPLFYDNGTAASTQDQNVQKRSVAPFARAEWFKRGDAWQEGQDVHSTFGCAGCHFTGNTTNKNQCDPGRGFDMLATVQDGVPALSKKQVVTGYAADGTAILAANGAEISAEIKKHDTRNTVKRCEFCHVTGKDYYGNTIDTFGAPNPTTRHQATGLMANNVQIADKMDPHGTFGGQGISKNSNFTSPNTKLGIGNHLDVMDCTVCHVQKISMGVRALDGASGMRYPSVVGTDPEKGMMGMFEDPAPDSSNAAAVAQYNGMYTNINSMFGYTGGELPGTLGAVGSPMAGVAGPGYQAMIPAGTHVIGSKLQEWKPLVIWQKLGNMEAPLTASFTGSSNGGASQMNFRRKIYLSNSISALIWNNTDPAIDANGDSVNGGLLIGENDELGRSAKPSLVGYTDVFDGDPVDKNNTQGYGDPIYDAYIMRDLKAGMTFGPSALSVIPVGFGNGAFQSAYTPAGLFTGAWKYASIWSGAVTFTEPEEITAYKAYRSAMPGAKSWAGTKMTVVGVPFMVTHGVKRVSTYAKGKSCADCHSASAEFFTGGFNMVGTAIPASATYNPTAKLNPVQNPVTGNFDRSPGLPGFESASNLMERPLERFRIKSLANDLDTAFEGFNKLGQPRNTKFQGTDGTYSWTKDLERADALYPVEDGAIYYTINDWNADGTLKVGAVAKTGAQYAAYMNTLGTPAASGIGVKPFANFSTAASVDKDRQSPGVQVYTGAPVALTADVAQVGGVVKYDWIISENSGLVDNPATLTVDESYITTKLSGINASVTFTTLGKKVIVLKVTDEEGNVVSKTREVEVIAPQASVITWANGAGVNDGTLSLTNLPVPNNKLKIIWGDGNYEYVTTTNAASLANKAHTYSTAGSKFVQVYVYQSGLQKGYFRANITVTP